MDRNLIDIAVSDTGFVFDPTTGQTFRLNKSALFIVRTLQTGAKLNQVAEKLAEQFNVDKSSAKEDVKEFLSLMAKMGFKFDAS